MASIERRGDGRPGWTVRWRDETGRQRKKSFVRKVDADRFRAEVEHTLATGAYIDPRAGRTPFGGYAEKWAAMQPHRVNTQKRTRSQLKKHLLPAFGRRPLSAIRHSEIQAFVSSLPLAPSSVRPVFHTLRAILHAAARDRLIAIDPAQHIKLPEVVREQLVLLTVDQVAALAASIAPRYRALVEVDAMTGLRQGEIFALRVSDIDRESREIVVDRQIQPAPGGGVRVGPLKNRASYRTLPVGTAVLDALARHLKEYPAEGDEYVFRDDRGEPLSRSTFEDDWHRARVAAGLPDVGQHDLRHFFASLLIRAGLNVKVVAARLGHADPGLTLRTYTHLWPDDADRSRDAIDAVFRSDVPRARPAEAA